MKNYMVFCLPLLATLLWIVSQYATASEIYTWKDENGNLHYGDSSAISRTDASVKRIRAINPVKNSFAISSDSSPHKSVESLPLPTDTQVAASQTQKNTTSVKDNGTGQEKNDDKNQITTPAVHTLLDTAEQYIQIGQLDRAAAIVERALRLQSDYSKSWQHLANIYQQQGRYEQAYFLKQKANQISGY